MADIIAAEARQAPDTSRASASDLLDRLRAAWSVQKRQRKEGPMKLTARPLTPDLWPALEDLFGSNGACNRCWCMYWRIGAAYRKRSRAEE
jgi:hypothetical protein